MNAPQTPQAPKRSNQEELQRIYELLERAEKRQYEVHYFGINVRSWTAFGFLIIVFSCGSMCQKINPIFPTKTNFSSRD